jgi:hypothetical protein|tara:strand:+ start:533 stop:721 length:189 start_codon:yes stop_codon:yes gene_type:complete
MKNIEGFIYYMRGDLIKDVKNRYGIVIDGNNLDDRFVTAYIFGHGQKIVHDTRVKLISTNKG